MLQFFKSRTYTFHPQIVIKTFEGNGKNLSIVIKTFERTGKSLPPPSIISKEDERSMSQGRISEGDKPPVQQENSRPNGLLFSGELLETLKFNLGTSTKFTLS